MQSLGKAILEKEDLTRKSNKKHTMVSGYLSTTEKDWTATTILNLLRAVTEYKAGLSKKPHLVEKD